MANGDTTPDAIKNGDGDTAEVEEEPDWENIAREKLKRRERELWSRTADEAESEFHASYESGDDTARAFFTLLNSFDEYRDIIAIDLHEIGALSTQEYHLQNIAGSVYYSLFMTRNAWRTETENEEQIFERARAGLERAGSFLDELEAEYLHPEDEWHGWDSDRVTGSARFRMPKIGAVFEEDDGGAGVGIHSSKDHVTVSANFEADDGSRISAGADLDKENARELREQLGKAIREMDEADD